ncbi:ribonuclease VapC [Clostridia bacterium]|nr:ribonuclease VapC [Clostridia bacterium]
MIYALDTNIIIHLLQGTPAVKQRRDRAVEQGAVLVIPPIVHYEMRRGFMYQSVLTKEAVYRLMCERHPIGEMTLEIWEAAAALYADTRKAGISAADADLLIAAFCIVENYILVTNNTKHFVQLKGLQLTDWV